MGRLKLISQFVESEHAGGALLGVYAGVGVRNSLSRLQSMLAGTSGVGWLVLEAYAGAPARSLLAES